MPVTILSISPNGKVEVNGKEIDFICAQIGALEMRLIELSYQTDF